MTNPINEWADGFGNQVETRTNVLDLASHYPYSPERWRLFVDGSRIFPEYASPNLSALDQYSHGRAGGSTPKDVHTLAPNAGETVVFESAERPRYVVQFELAATVAAQLNQELVGNDRLRLGLYDGSDGWYFEQRSDHAADECELVAEREGTEIYRSDDPVPIQRVTTAFSRLKLTTGWYNVTRQAWEQSYSDDGQQRNTILGGDTSADDQRDPTTGNLPIHFEVTADGSTTDLELFAGSAAQVNLGTTTPQIRTKTASFTATISTTGTWVPVYAIRTDPARDIINVQVTDTDVVSFLDTDDIRVMPVAFAAEKLADGSGNALVDGDFSTPAEHAPTNSVIEETTVVDQFPDSGGTVGASTADPGGHQLGYASWYSTGTGSKSQVQSRTSTRKRSLPRDDVCVFLANATATGDVTVEYVTEQDW